MDILEQELRFYCFVNFYLSSMQQGIQTGHCSVDLVRKYTTTNALVGTEMTELVEMWADNYKTYIILNGGDADRIDELTRIIATGDFPFCVFHEAEGALKGVQTCVGLILPECVFKARPAVVTKDGNIVNAFVAEIEDDNTGAILRYEYPEDHSWYELIKAVVGSRMAI